MPSEKSNQEKLRLHPRNKNRERYDLNALTIATPELGRYVMRNKFGIETVDFSNPIVVRLLNKAILNYYYGIKDWEFPAENLCPPIPGRADYIHHLADLLGENNLDKIPIGDKITCFDVGIGASCIYPIIGVTEYGWKFIGSDIDPKSMDAAQAIVNSNLVLKNKVECRLQKNTTAIFQGIINKEEKIDLVICNPPFHASIEEAQKESSRKIKNLSGKKVKNPQLNFSGINNELICEGGEYKFIQNMIVESEKFAKNCLWFSTLISKQSNIEGINSLLEKIGAKQIKMISMATANKSSRFVAWTFLSKVDQREWKKSRWKS